MMIGMFADRKIRVYDTSLLNRRHVMVMFADRKIRVYDTSHDEFNEMCCIQAQDVGWSILDLALRSVCLSLCLSVCLSVCLPICLVC